MTEPTVQRTEQTRELSPISRIVQAAFSLTAVITIGAMLGAIWAIAAYLRTFFAVARRLRLEALGPVFPPVAAVGLPVVLAALSTRVTWSGLRDLEAASFGWLLLFSMLLAVLVKQVWARLKPTAMTMAEMQERNAVAWPERWYVTRMKQPIDAHFTRTIVHLALGVIPAAVVLAIPAYRNPLTGLLFLYAHAAFLLPMGILGHTCLHNRIFNTRHLTKRSDRAVLRSTEWFLAAVIDGIFLAIPNHYDAQHRSIHHAEDNGLADVQTTITSDRTSFVDFCRQCLRFAFNFMFGVELLVYLRRGGRNRAVGRLAAGLVFWYAVLALIAWHSWPLALFLWTLRLIQTWPLMASIMTWHAFADPDEPDNIYRSNADLYFGDTTDHGSYSDSLHLNHHLHPSWHWTVCAERAAADNATYVEQGAIRFRAGDGSVARMGAMWRRDYDAIVDDIVPYEGDTRTREELLQVVEHRLKPVNYRPRSRVSRSVDRGLGEVAARLVPLAPDVDWTRI